MLNWVLLQQKNTVQSRAKFQPLRRLRSVQPKIGISRFSGQNLAKTGLNLLPSLAMSLSRLLELDVEWTHKAQSISVGYLEIFIYPGVGWMFLGKISTSGWWFQICFHVHPDPWGWFPIWLIFFNWIETTNKFCMARKVKGFSIVQISWELTWHLKMATPNKKEIPIGNHHL